MEISKILKERREELGLKVKDIALELGVAESTYREWENGRKIQGEPYLKLSKALNLPLGALLNIDQSKLLSSLLNEINELEKHVKNIKRNAIQLL
jgi:transcriptional regulator with XRE-family HTH domain